jgi:hypothetical protein
MGFGSSPAMGTSAIGAVSDTGAGDRRRSGLLIFNIKTDATDDVLGFTTDWINAIAAHWDRVFVITMAGGKIDVAENVRVFSLGQERNYSRPRRGVAAASSAPYSNPVVVRAPGAAADAEGGASAGRSRRHLAF